MGGGGGVYFFQSGVVCDWLSSETITLLGQSGFNVSQYCRKRKKYKCDTAVVGVLVLELYVTC